MSGITNTFFNNGFPGADKLMERMFRRVDNVAWDLMTGKIGVRTDEGIFSVEGTGDDATIVGNLFDGASMAVPAFAQSTSVSDVKVGDLILRGNSPAWVVERKEPKITFDKDTAGNDIDGTAKVTGQVSFKLLKPNGETAAWKAPKIQMLGFDAGGVMVVRSLMSMMPGGQADLSAMQGMLMPMMMLAGDGGSDDMMSKMLPMMLMMGQQNGGIAGQGQNMMMPMMMAMMMKGGNNPFGGGYGKPKPVYRDASPFSKD